MADPALDGHAPASERVRVRRLPERARYDLDTVHAVLDEGLVGHLGFVDDGQPYVVPMAYARDGDRLLLHGSTGGRLALRVVGQPACFTVTLLDGLVLARSVFHHSMNYRSAVVVGVPELVTDETAKRDGLNRIVEHLAPGQTDAARPPTSRELAGTALLELPLRECSAKLRTGWPGDEDEDYQLPVWAGVLPLGLTAGPLQPDPANLAGAEVPAHLAELANLERFSGAATR